MKPVITIIIVTWNTKDLIKQCLESIFKKDKRLDFSGKKIDPTDEETTPAEIIVVDNNSTDGSVQYLKKISKKIKNLKIIYNKENTGFAKANNQAIKAAQGEYVLLLNSDTIIPEASISQTLFWLANHPEAAVVGCKLLNRDGTDQGSYGNFPDLKTVFLMLFCEKIFGSKRVRTSGKQIEQVDWLVGAFFIARAWVFEKIGGLDETIFMYMEEVEWFYRLSKENLKAYFYPNAKIIHLGGASSKSGRSDPIINIFKGLVHFYKKHNPKWQLTILKIMLKTKAVISLLIGYLTNNNYLKKTYGQAFNVV